MLGELVDNRRRRNLRTPLAKRFNNECLPILHIHPASTCARAHLRTCALAHLLGLFQNHNRIDAGRACRGDPACRERHDTKEDSDCREDHRI